MFVRCLRGISDKAPRLRASRKGATVRHPEDGGLAIAEAAVDNSKRPRPPSDCVVEDESRLSLVPGPRLRAAAAVIRGLERE